MKMRFISLESVYHNRKLIFSVNILLLCAIISLSKETIAADFNTALFSLGKLPNESDVLYQFKPSLSKWIKVGNTGTTEIYSIAIDTENFIIYAVNGGTLGTLNPVTGKYTAIGNIGGGNGADGYRSINNIYGLTFDPIEKKLYGTNRVNGSEDILVKINPVNGKLMKKQFINLAFQQLDYATIESAVDKATVHPTALKDVSSLLYEPITNQLLCIQRKFDKIALSLINKNTGFLLEVVFDLSSTGIFSIDYDLSGNIYATTLNEINNESGVIQMDLGFVSINIVNPAYNNIPDLQFIALAFAETTPIQNCQNEINLICTSPQMPEIKAKHAIHSNADLFMNTSYKTEGYISLENYFSIPANINFSVEITNVCK